MPYKLDSPNLPKQVKEAGESRKRQWIAIWNDTFQKCITNGGSPETCEAGSFRKANGVVFQQEEEDMSKLTFAVNQAVKATTRNVGGIDYLVAPVVLVKEGILNGEFLGAEVIGSYPEAWNGTPFILEHPEDAKGVKIPANQPELLDQILLGRVFNVYVDGPTLKGEVWVDPTKASKVSNGEEVVRRLMNGVPLEVSTAYYRDREDTVGAFQGEEFMGVQRNLKPEHLAALLDTEGACSWADGCGAPRVNEQQDREVTMDEIVNQIVADGRLGLRTEELEPLPASVLEKIGDFLKSIPLPTEPDDDDLPAQEDGPPADNDDEPADDVDNEPADDEPDNDDEPEPQTQDDDDPEPATTMQVFMDAVEERGGVAAVMGILDGVQSNQANEKAQIVLDIKANKASAFTDEQLAEMDVCQLVALRKSLKPADYGAQGGGGSQQIVTSNKDEEFKLSPMGL